MRRSFPIISNVSQSRIVKGRASRIASRALAVVLLHMSASLAEPSPCLAGENYAFLVAVGEYDRTELRPLKYTRADVRDFRAALVAAGFKPANIVLLQDNPAELQNTRFLSLADNIRDEMTLLLSGLERDDALIMAFAGHGVQFQGEKESYFCPRNAKLAKRDSLISFADVLKRMDQCKASHKLLLVDACRNEPQTDIARSRAEVNLESVTRPQQIEIPKSLLALFSCGPGQQSFEDPDLGHGVFFHHVLKGWNGAADRNSDGELEFTELESYVRRETKEYARLSLKALQTPQFKGELSDEWVLRKLERIRLSAGTKPGQEWDGNGLKMDFCWCPDGSFTMGSPKSEPDRHNDEEQVKVTLTGFWMGKYEVTQAEWKSVIGKTIEEQDAQQDAFDDVFRREGINGKGPRYPIYHVRHAQATEFCRKLTEQERNAGRLPASWEFRLPTEAQWEYACRAGTKTATSLGAVPPMGETKPAEFPRKPESRYIHRELSEVGRSRANPWGIHDMHGNVWEWSRDWYADALPGGRDPEASVRPSDHSGFHVHRGGYSIGGRLSRSAERSGAPFGERYLGFRVAIVRTVK